MENLVKGCAIVEYATREDAKRSIKELNDTTFEGEITGA